MVWNEEKLLNETIFTTTHSRQPFLKKTYLGCDHVNL